MRVRLAPALIAASSFTRSSPLALVIAVLCAMNTYAAHAETDGDLLNMDLETLLTIKVGPSADASAKGLSEAYAGGQIAKGGRIGILSTQDLMDTPFSFTNYTQEFIQNHQAASVGDVLQYDPSVRVARGFGNFQQVYKVRGLPIFSDDMTYNGLYGILPRQYLAAEAIERVEVLRGSNSFLNGAAPGVSGSLGGAIDVIPKRAPKEALTQFTLGAQSAAQFYAATDLARRSDDGRFGIRFNGVDSGGDTPVNGATRELGLAILGADYRGIALRLSADLGYQDHQLKATQPSISIADDVAIPAAPHATSQLAQPWSNANASDVFGTLRAEYDLTETLTGWAAIGLREGSEDSRLGAFQTVFNTAGDFSSSRFDVIHKDSVTTSELGLRTHFQTGEIQHQLTFALNNFQNHSRNAYVIYSGFNTNLYQPADVALPTDTLFSAGSWNQPHTTNTTKTASTALADELALFDQKLLFTLGVLDQRIQEYNYSYDTGAESSHYDEHQLTPLVALNYKLSPRMSLYGKYIEGLLKGDIAPANSSNGTVANAGEALAPYKTQHTELGLKYDAGTMGTSLSLFQIRKPLAGYSSNNRFGINHYQYYEGLEVSVYGELTPNLKLLGGASLLTTKDQGLAVLGTPKLQTNVDMEWTLPQWPKLTLSGHLMHTSSQYANAANTQQVPAWTRLDLGMRYLTTLGDAHSLVLRVNIENLTNADYWASVGGFPGANYLTLGDPRSVRASATISF